MFNKNGNQYLNNVVADIGEFYKSGNGFQPDISSCKDLDMSFQKDREKRVKEEKDEI